MGLPKITFNISANGLDRLGDDVQKTPGLVITGATVAAGVTLGESNQIFSLADAEDLGIEAVGVNAFAHKHISDFYTSAEIGTPLWIMLVSDATTMEDMADLNEAYANKLIGDAKGVIRVLGLVRKSNAAETIVEALDEDAKLAAIKLQALATYYEGKYMPFRAVISGNVFSGVTADLFDYQTANYPNVNMVIVNNDGAPEAFIGRVLGRIASIPSQRSMARVKDGAIEPLAAFFTDGSTVESKINEWDAIHDKGYTFMRTFAGRSGYYMSDDRTLCPVENDFSALGRGFVMDEAVLIAYDVLVEELSEEVPLTEAGLIHPAIIKGWQSNIETQIEGLMVAEGKLSGVEALIAEDQNILQDDTLTVTVRLQPVGYAKYIEVNIGFTTQINN